MRDMSLRQDSKIAYILHRFPVLSETFVIDEISGVRSNGVEICIFSFEKSLNGLTHKETKGLVEDTFYALNPKESIKTFLKIFVSNLSFFLSFPLKYCRCFFKYFLKIGKKEFLQVFYLGRLIRKKGVRHLHAHFACLGATAAMIISRFLNIPFSFTVHAHDLFAEDDFLEEKLKEAKFIIAISDYNRNYLLGRFADIPAEKIKVIHCGVDVEKFKPVDSRGGGVIKILSGGRLIEKKGFGYLIKACKLLIERGVKFRCEIFGQGPLKDSLANEVRELGLEGAVHFTGAVTREELGQLLVESDIFVLPSIITDDGDRDGIPVVLMEAMSCGKAVISTDISGIPELISSGRDGILVAQKSEIELVKAILNLIEDKELRQRLEAKAREKVIEKFNLTKNVKIVAEILSSLT